MKLYDLVMVEWEDSRQAISQWQRVESIETPPVALCASAGWIVEMNKSKICLAQTLGDMDDPECFQAAGVNAIPRSAIRKVKIIISRSSSAFLACRQSVSKPSQRVS